MSEILCKCLEANELLHIGMAGDICRSMSSSKICTESDVYYDNLYIQQARPIDFWPVKTKFSLPLTQGQKVDLSSFQKLKTMLSNTEPGSHKET